MTITMNVQEAKGRLSHLVAEAERGNEVVIARAGTPVVRLVPVTPQSRRLGVFATELSPHSVAESLAPLDDDQLALWTGGA
ncbi:MAG: type II toxin-antitoxin system prevent-host-death family antitoxin [Micrococcales bacterium]|nr:type II toxin-antitoxin system prevent-host-death family antitoxin [Micrococcales bacterium]